MKKAILAAAALALGSAAYAADKSGSVAVVNGRKVAQEELTKKLWWQYAAQGLTELVDEKLLLEEGARLGVKADPKEVEQRFSDLSAGYTEKGSFEASLKSVGWSPKELRDLLSRQLVIRGAVVTAKKIAVTDENAKVFFEKNTEKLGTPESVKLSQIFVNTKAEADDAYELLTSVGADFAKLSNIKSADANLRKNNGSLGVISRGILLPEIVEKEVFALQAGQFTRPIATGNGFSIFKVEERKPGVPADYEKIKEEIKSALLNQAITQQLSVLVAELRQKARIEILK